MDKTILNVPRGIEYLSDWEGFSLPVTPTIINKQITGCGFTEWCIRSTDNIVLCSPRCVLLDNKAEQHPEDVFYAKNELDESLEVDKDLISDKPTKEKVEKILSASELEEIKESVQRFRDSIFIHYFNCCQGSKPCKILVTYDSFRHVKEALGDHIKDLGQLYGLAGCSLNLFGKFIKNRHTSFSQLSQFGTLQHTGTLNLTISKNNPLHINAQSRCNISKHLGRIN